MSNFVDEHPQELVPDNEQKSSPTRVAADHSDIELMERSQAFLDVMKQVDCVSDTNLPVLLIGEPGTGRQLVACAIHQRSSRSNQPFIAVNCAALASDAMDPEISGVEGGTIFLDEITATDLSLQDKLLRLLNTIENFRVIAASSRNIENEVAAGRFSPDLFHALRGLTIVLPAQRTFQTKNGTSQPAPDEPVNGEWVTLSEIEGRYVARVLHHTGGNKQAAARVLSVDRKTLDRMIKRHHIIYPHTRHRAKASVSS